MKTCRYCDQENSNYSHYCANCGKRLSYVDYSVVPTYELDALRKDSRELQKYKEKERNSWICKVKQLRKKEWGENILIGIGSIVLFFLTFIGIFFLDTLYKGCSDHNNNARFELIKDNVTGKYGLKDVLNDKVTIACQFDSIFHEKGNYEFFYLYDYATRKWGVADSTGHITINCTLDSVLPIMNNTGLLITYNADKRGLVSRYGEVVVPCQYATVLAEGYLLQYLYYVGNIIPVKNSKKSDWTLLNRKGKRICYHTFCDVEQTNLPDLIKIKDNSWKWGLMDTKGDYILPCEYNSISKFDNNRAWTRKTYSGDWGCISSDGKKIFSLPSSYYPYEFSEGLAAVSDRNKKIGYCDTLGKFVIQCKYEVVRKSESSYYSPSFYRRIDGNAAHVSYEGKNGVIDKQGNFTPD